MLRFFPNGPVRRRLLKLFIAIAAMPLLAVGSCEALIKTAEWRAQSFCDGIPLGSDIGLAIHRFEGTTGKPDVRHYSQSNGAGHSFVFPSALKTAHTATCRSILAGTSSQSAHSPYTTKQLQLQLAAEAMGSICSSVLPVMFAKGSSAITGRSRVTGLGRATRVQDAGYARSMSKVLY